MENGELSRSMESFPDLSSTFGSFGSKNFEIRIFGLRPHDTFFRDGNFTKMIVWQRYRVSVYHFISIAFVVDNVFNPTVVCIL